MNENGTPRGPGGSYDADAPREYEDVRRAYRGLDDEPVPPALDASVLEAARAAVRPQRARPRWLVPASLAATVLLAVGISLDVKREAAREAQQYAGEARTQTVNGTALTAVPEAAVANGGADAAASAVADDGRAPDGAAEGAASRRGAPARDAASEAAPAEPTARPAQGAPYAPPPVAPARVAPLPTLDLPVVTGPPSESAIVIPKQSIEAPATVAAQAPAPEPMPAAPPPPAPAPTPVSPPPPAPRAAAPIAAPAATQAADAARAERDAAARADRDAAAERRKTEAAHRDPEQWLREIDALRRAGRTADADAELARFRAAYPDYRLR